MLFLLSAVCLLVLGLLYGFPALMGWVDMQVGEFPVLEVLVGVFLLSVIGGVAVQQWHRKSV